MPRPELGPIGIWSGELRFGHQERAAEVAAELESLGFGALWIPGGFDHPFDPARAALGATSRLVLASGIVNLWSVPAAEAAAAHAQITAVHPGRFLMGIGVSHSALVDRDEPGRYQHPLAVMANYLDEVDAQPQPVPADERVLAALGPRMLALAAQRAAGAHPYLVPAEHTARARQVLGPGPLLAPEVAVVLESDPGRAREIARGHLQAGLNMPNYSNNWRRLGFGDDDLSGGGSDRLVDAVVAWGEPETVAEKVRAHRDAGADHVCVQVIAADRSQLPLEEWRRLAGVLT